MLSLHRAIGAIALLIGVVSVSAQQAEVRAGAGPYYAGVPITIALVVEGFEQSPQPEVEVNASGGGALDLIDIRPNVSTSIQIVNGRMSRQERVRFVYRYRLLVSSPGSVEVGPFRVSQGATQANARKVRFQVEGLPSTDEQRLRLVMAQGPYWVGQRVPVSLEWWLTEEFAERLAGRRARVPLFEQVDRFKFEDVQTPGARSTLTIDTANGELELPIEINRGEWQGKSYLVVTAKRTLIALKAGTVDVPPATLTTEEGVRWRRDVFGNRSPTQVRRLRVEDKPRTLEFRSPPATGRPPSFSGAVGKGFAVEVKADRSVVHTGDPIELSIDIRGDVALETVSLPDLALSGLGSADFKTPNGASAGTVSDGVKRFQVAVRVNHDQVREIPPIAFSWFNPETGAYETTHSRPIAVSVRQADVVSAADVVRSKPSEDEARPQADDDKPNSEDAPGSGARAPTPAFSLTGAELSIATDLNALRGAGPPWYAQSFMLIALYAAGLLVIGLGCIARRRLAVDPAVRARQQKLERERQAIQRATDVRELAAALRKMASTAATIPREAFDAVLVDCDNLAFAPQGATHLGVNDELRIQAMLVANNIIKGAQ